VFRAALEALFRIPVPAWQATRSGAATATLLAAGRVVAEGADPDRKLTWVITEEPSGNLKAVISAADAAHLRGATILLNTDPRRPITVDAGASEARIAFEISREEWHRMAGTPLILQVTFADGNTISSE
jgi:hypothetical protein